MLRSVTRDTVGIVVDGVQVIELHAAAVQALAVHVPELRSHSSTQQTAANLAASLEALLHSEDPQGPIAWRFVDTSSAYLGPAFFAVSGNTHVASCDTATLTVGNTGFTLNDEGTELQVPAIEDGKGIIQEDGKEAGPIGPASETLLGDLASGHYYVTAVPASYAFAIMQPLLQLRAAVLPAPMSGLVTLTKP